jgi:methylmalonyl-CoA mutase cobalamin-binding subunit
MRRILQSKGAEIIHLGHNRSVHEIVECALKKTCKVSPLLPTRAAMWSFLNT